MFAPRAVAAAAVLLILASPALAQDSAPAEPAGAPATAQPALPPDPEKPSVFAVIGGDFKHFFSADTAQVMSMMAVASIAGTPWDGEAVEESDEILSESFFGAGQVTGSFAFQAGMGALTYGVGRAAGSAKAADVGVDLIRAQIVSQVLVQAVKYTVQRERPDGSDNHSFPSGHSASAFATGTVLQRHFGWKGAVPGYAFGAYIALSRMSENKHHLSDVIMGAGFGLAAGRTVTLDLAGRKFGVGVDPTPGGAAITFTRRP